MGLYRLIRDAECARESTGSYTDGYGPPEIMTQDWFNGQWDKTQTISMHIFYICSSSLWVKIAQPFYGSSTEQRHFCNSSKRCLSHKGIIINIHLGRQDGEITRWSLRIHASPHHHQEDDTNGNIEQARQVSDLKATSTDRSF